jgi:hypothetical protein
MTITAADRALAVELSREASRAIDALKSLTARAWKADL